MSSVPTSSSIPTSSSVAASDNSYNEKEYIIIYKKCNELLLINYINTIIYGFILIILFFLFINDINK